MNLVSSNSHVVRCAKCSINTKVSYFHRIGNGLYMSTPFIFLFAIYIRFSKSTLKPDCLVEDNGLNIKISNFFILLANFWKIQSYNEVLLVVKLPYLQAFLFFAYINLSSSFMYTVKSYHFSIGIPTRM